MSKRARGRRNLEPRRSGLQLSVNNERCRRFGFCHAEAPELFQLLITGELRYERRVPQDQIEAARSATRCCPTLAIALEDK